MLVVALSTDKPLQMSSEADSLREVLQSFLLPKGLSMPKLGTLASKPQLLAQERISPMSVKNASTNYFKKKSLSCVEIRPPERIETLETPCRLF